MKRGRPLPALADELHRQAACKRDFLAPAHALRVRSNGHTDLILGETYTVSEVAHGQIADYAGVPKAFYDRLRGATSDLRIPPPEANSEQDGAPLFDVLLNSLLRAKGADGRLVRTLDGKARAFLSSTFNPDLDNWDVFQVAARAIEEAGLGPGNVASAEVTERRLYLKVVSPRLEAVVRPENVRSPHGYLREPQVVQAGFVLTNSETGLGSLSVQQVVYKLMCTNLWIKEEAYRQRHLGKALQADNGGQVYRSDTRLADARAKLLKVRDHVAGALDETRFRALVAQMQETTGVKLEAGVEKVVEVTGRKFGLSLSEKEGVLRHLIAGADLSLWGLTNAVTAAASDLDGYDRATELEAIGGRMLTLPAAEVKEIVSAQ